MRIKLESKKKRTLSQRRWLERQLNDPYVQAAKKEGYRSRAAFKLVELDKKFHLLKPGLRVVDLGAAPGGWSQVAAKAVQAQGKGGGLVVALDIQAMDSVPGATLITLDFLDPQAPERLMRALGGPADLVLSDMAAPTTGHAATDHLKIMALAEAAFEFATQVLAPGGAFVAKVFQGGSERTLLAALKLRFQSVRHAKPPASRTDSAETYVVAQGFKPG
ncbi:MAG: RlmE family RNA methyltransferase [Rhodospirillales bacterium]|nr:RlmE family RNA methyltransferase [Rhodospirillales bacterium]